MTIEIEEDRIVIDGKTYMAVDSSFENPYSCEGCFFDHNNECKLDSPNLYCGSSKRKDKRNIIYKEVVE